MSNGYRNGAFALGLVVGGGIALNIFLWLDYRARREKHTQSDDTQGSQYSEIGNYWDGLIGTFISPSDTLAQWVMAFFTIAATGVLILTLRSANKTNLAAIKASRAALEANAIMRQQSAGYLVIDGVEIQAQKYGVIVLVTAKNIGQRPVRMGRVEGLVSFSWRKENDGDKRIAVRAKTSDDVFIGVVEPTQKRSAVGYIEWSRFSISGDDYMKQVVGNTDVMFDCLISWSDSMSAPNNERHILNAYSASDILDPDMGKITKLEVGYSGSARDVEEWVHKNEPKD